MPSQGSTAPPRGSPTKAKECNPISEEVKSISQKFLRTSYGDQRQKGFHNLASVITFVHDDANEDSGRRGRG